MEKEKLWKYYAGIFPTFDMFNQIFDRCTQDKRVMVIDSLSESSKIEEQIYWYKADLHDEFRICYDEFWENNAYYLKQRLEQNDPTAGTQEDDDYYKYVGGNRNKVVFNLNIDENADARDADDRW